LAAPDSPVTVTAPPAIASPFVPGVRAVADLEPAYVEEEYFIEGLADLYTHGIPAVRGEVFVLEEGLPYRTRMIVRRPVKPGRFNGVVVIEWWNSTATFDTAPVWDPSAEYFARKGYVYVGFTNANQSLSHLVGGCRLFGVLPPTCAGRYASLSMPDDGLAYDIASQLAHLLKNGGEQSPLAPDYKVRHVFHAGQSQQGGSMIAYVNNFHSEVNDGYFVQAATRARSICGTSGTPLPPGCIPQPDDAAERLVRGDLPVPVYRAMTENDVVRGADSRQSDTDLFRYYEIAGTAHTTVHEDIELIPGGVLGPDPLFLEDACLLPINSLADGPVLGSHVYNAMWQNMRETVRSGTPAPHADPIDRDAVTGEVLRDTFGNALGGIAPSQIQVPRATYGPRNEPNPANLPGPLILLGNLFCFLSGTVEPFDQQTLDALYPQPYLYVADVKEAALDLVDQRFLLLEDAKREIDTAVEVSSVPKCGLGFELVALLPPLLWARGRRRRDAPAGRPD
jgi:hypothetical protein